jgi:exopolyphosphatase/guanosine-5'-triphosphate,3'-diphosphate pyrophosphatase
VPKRAAVDVGTNSVRLLVAEVGWRGPRTAVVPVLQRLETTRLGAGLAPGGMISEAAAARTADAVRGFAALAEEAGAGAPVIVGTHALRVAANPEILLSRMPHPVRILSGEEEARLGYIGVLAGFPDAPDADAGRALLVIDIGGGSVELTRGGGEGIERSRSVPAGAVVLTERFLAHDPPLASEVAALRAHLARTLRLEPAAAARAGQVVGVGGTITTLAAMAQRLSPYDPRKVHGFYLPRPAVDAIAADLASRPIAERRHLPGLQPPRADIILAGALVLQHLLALVQAPGLRVSEADMLWGLVIEASSASGV